MIDVKKLNENTCRKMVAEIQGKLQPFAELFFRLSTKENILYQKLGHLGISSRNALQYSSGHTFRITDILAT